MTASRDAATTVLVPGGFLGAWIWSDVVGLLAHDGIDVVALDLTSVVGQCSAAVGDLYEDARAVREVLDDLEPPVLLCGHSYGGAVITEAAAGPHPVVRHLVYLAAAAPGQGQSLMATALEDAGGAAEAASEEAASEEAEPTPEPVVILDDGTVALVRESARDGLFNDCDAQRAEPALAQLRPMNPVVNSQPVSAVAWAQLPVTYVRCSQDRLPEVLASGFLERVTDVVELDTGHCPQWSRPELVAHLLADRARRLVARSAGSEDR